MKILLFFCIQISIWLPIPVFLVLLFSSIPVSLETQNSISVVICNQFFFILPHSYSETCLCCQVTLFLIVIKIQVANMWVIQLFERFLYCAYLLSMFDLAHVSVQKLLQAIKSAEVEHAFYNTQQFLEIYKITISITEISTLYIFPIDKNKQYSMQSNRL